jgi:hypothetical protein
MKPKVRIHLRRGVIALCLIALPAAVSAWSASAGSPPQFLVTFGETGTGAGQSTNPRGLAADSTDGHVYVSDLGNKRIDEFTSWGKFVRAWGWGVDTGAAALEVCTEASTCQAGSAGSGAGQFGNPLGVAVDSAGNVYVVDLTNHRVEKFSHTGEFILMFGGGVNQTTGEDVCTKVQLDGGNVCGAGTTGSAPGQFGAWQVGSFIAVGPGDQIYVGDNNRIQKFASTGVVEPSGEIALPGEGFIKSLAIDPSGNLYIASQNSPAVVRKLNPSGTVLETLEGIGVPTGLATDSNANVYVVDSSAGGPRIHKLNSSGKSLATWGEGEFTGSTGIGTNGQGDVYVSNSTPTNSFVRAYGPLPTYEPPPAVAPTIAAEYADSVGTTSARVDAVLNSHFWDTDYFVQYGPAPCSASACSQQPVSPATLSADSRGDTTVGLTVEGLTPGSTYYYRFVASSGGGGPVFGPDRSFSTRVATGAGLPDDRAYEMVSPPGKNSAELGVPTKAGGFGGALGFSVRPQQAASSGVAVTYASATAFGEAEGAPGASQYLSKRGSSGWSTENIGPRFEESYFRDPLVGFSSDLSNAAVIVLEPPLTGDADQELPNIYRRDNEAGAYTALTTEPPLPGISVPKSKYCLSYGGASTDFSRVAFAAKGALIPGDPVADGFNLYEWSATDGLHLVSRLPNGDPATPQTNTGFGGLSGESFCNMSTSLMRHAISANGSRIFWTLQGNYVGAEEPLFARLGGTETVQIDAPNQGVASPGGRGRYEDASANGSKVFFTDTERLTADSTALAEHPDLYRYDFGRPQGERLTDLSSDPSETADVAGVLGDSEDGSYVYFVAKGALTGAEENANHEKAQPGQSNLFAWHEGEGLRFIATLSAEDATDWSRRPDFQTARVTPDGRGLAFLSTASLTGYDNAIANGSSSCGISAGNQTLGAGCPEVYVYDFQNAQLSCASCDPSGARPLGAAAVPTWSTPYEQPRYLSDDGLRLFFETADALDLHDTNGKRDVYEFERAGLGSCSSESPTFSPASRGCLYLISSGASGDESYLIDASTTGGDVFISTRQALSPRDEDERYDIYDARVGGSETPLSPASPCSGEACRPGETRPGVAAPGSASFAGNGNLKSRKPARVRCSPGKRRARHSRTAHCKRKHKRAHRRRSTER